MNKNLKYSIFGAALLMLTLAFASPNNLGLNFAEIGSTDLEEIPLEEVSKRVDDKVIAPIKKAMEAQNPHLFMTKCYSRLSHDIKMDPSVNIGPKYYENSTVAGQVVFTDCGRTEYLGQFRLNLTTNEVEMKESYFKPWVSLDAFIEQINPKKN